MPQVRFRRFAVCLLQFAFYNLLFAFCFSHSVFCACQIPPASCFIISAERVFVKMRKGKIVRQILP
ncbi:hypothetical protein DWX76_09475 [Clostridium sp. AF21-20LB]|nr:hypothetical protein DWX76_09475 [Clostridium sp. AF21-20LB]